jgi:hypothetical protein
MADTEAKAKTESKAEGDAGEESRTRLLFVGRFSPAPTGKLEVVTAERAGRPFEAAPLALTCAVADRLGGGSQREFKVAFGKLVDLKVSEVIKASPELGALRAIAEDLGAGRRDPAAAAAAVEGAVGAGPLSDALRSGNGTDARKRARDLIERAVFDTARDVLAAPAVAALESAWRGLRLSAERAGKEVEIQVLDIDPAGAVARLDGLLGETATFDRPDVVFVVEPLAKVDDVRAFAGLGADYSVPFVVEGTPALFGAASVKEIPLLADDAPAADGWTELRADDVAAWCTVALNRMVAGVDGAGAAARAVLTSPVFGVAALLTQSYVATGGPGRIFGQAGGLTAPGTHEVDAGRGEPLAIALEAFLSIDAQGKLAARGGLGLGGPRNSDRVQLAVAPLLAAAKDSGTLPSHILTARTIRFAQWTRDQLPDGTSDADVVTIFESAATALLFPNPDIAKLSAVVTPTKSGGRIVVCRTLARGEWVGVPIDVTFALPLPK